MSFAMAQYRTNEFQTASPAKVIVAFYDGALRFINLGAHALSSKNYALKGQHLSRAHAIVSELRAELDHTQNPGLCAELDRLYTYVLDCITEANIKLDATKLQHATRVMESLRSAWVQVADEASGVRLVGRP
jgi:flagellar protein FliS